LDEARSLLRDRKTEGACSRAYDAMHDAAHAALLATGIEASDPIIKTHHSLIAEFDKKLVLGGQIDAAHGRAFNRVRLRDDPWDTQQNRCAKFPPPSLRAEGESVPQGAAAAWIVSSPRTLRPGGRSSQ